MEAIITGSNYHDRRNLYTDDILVGCYLKHESQTKAAEELGISRETVARAVRRAGIQMIGRKNNGHHNGKYGGGSELKITDGQLVEEAKTMCCSEIATLHGMSEERVYRRAKRLGINLNMNWTGGHWRRRARRYNCTEFDETISLRGLFERDNGVCQICGRLTDVHDINNGHIGRMYPTLDHINPLSKGGTHTWDNVQLAHMSCNAGKRDKTKSTTGGGKL